MSRQEKIPVAAILAGGRATRMGQDKAGLPFGGRPLIEWVFDRVHPVSEHVVVVGGPPRLEHRGAGHAADRYPGTNAIGGIATALGYARAEVGRDTWVLCVACDMPYLEPALLLRLFRQRPGFDVVVPHTALGFEPLCALYHTRCLPTIEAQLAVGNLRIFDVYRRIRSREVPESELRRLDPGLRSFINLNRPEDLLRVPAGQQPGGERPSAAAGQPGLQPGSDPPETTRSRSK